MSSEQSTPSSEAETSPESPAVEKTTRPPAEAKAEESAAPTEAKTTAVAKPAAPAAVAKKPAAKPVARKKKKKKKPIQLAVIDQAGCTGCEACIPFCPVDCILIVPGPYGGNTVHDQLVEIELERCIGCTLCAKYCPWETIEMLSYDEAFEFAPDWTVRTVVYKDRDYEPEVDEPKPEKVTA